MRRKNGTIENTLSHAASSAECDIHARWRLGKNRIRVTVPRACIDGAALRISTMIGAGDGTSGDPADWTKTVRVLRG